MTLITSLSNPRISKLMSLHTSRGRKKSGLFFMEGPHLVTATLDAAVIPEEIYYQRELLQRTGDGRRLLQRLLHDSSLAHNTRLQEVSLQVIEGVSETETSQGIVALQSMAAFQPQVVTTRRPLRARAALVVLDGISDPGNLGTILRTALAADVERVLLSPDCVDSFNPKVVRAAAGAHLFLPLQSASSWDEIAHSIHQHDKERIFLAEASGRDLYYEQDLVAPFTLVTGNEAHGPSQSARSLATQTLAIPLSNGVESLNAAMATGIILYEAVRQRLTHETKAQP